MIAVNHPEPFSNLPDAALREYTKAAKAGWQDVPLVELLDRVNHVAVSFLPEVDRRGSQAGRVRRIFTERSFRHYQTLGCIDVPEKDGRRASYGFRHFLQALLVRKLLWEQVPARQIVTMLNGRGTDELERMLLGGVEIVARMGGGGSGGGGETQDHGSSVGPAERWNRVRVVPGIELHVRGGLPKPKPAELKQILAQIETALRKNQ
jgi:hypothetical protein